MSKQSTQMGYGKLNEEQLRILEDVPGSAVELQVKDKVRAIPVFANSLAIFTFFFIFSF